MPSNIKKHVPCYDKNPGPGFTKKILFWYTTTNTNNIYQIIKLYHFYFIYLCLDIIYIIYIFFLISIVLITMNYVFFITTKTPNLYKQKLPPKTLGTRFTRFFRVSTFPHRFICIFFLIHKSRKKSRPSRTALIINDKSRTKSRTFPKNRVPNPKIAYQKPICPTKIFKTIQHHQLLSY